MNIVINIAPQDLIILKDNIREIRHYSGRAIPINLDIHL
jgi:hypothetical protein